MTNERFVSAQVCDDIRQEIGNKYSLIGCYGPLMYVNSFPTFLPKLCAFVRVYTPIHKPFSKMSIRVLREDKILAEIDIPSQSLEAFRKGKQPDGITFQIVGTAIVLSPLPVEEPCVLRLEVETEDELLNGGTFRIEKALDRPENPSLPAPHPTH